MFTAILRITQYEITCRARAARDEGYCLAPVRRLSRPSRSMYFGDVAETDSQGLYALTARYKAEGLDFFMIDVTLQSDTRRTPDSF